MAINHNTIYTLRILVLYTVTFITIIHFYNYNGGGIYNRGFYIRQFYLVFEKNPIYIML